MNSRKIVPPEMDVWKRLSRKEQAAYLQANGLKFRNGRFLADNKKGN